MRVPSYFNTSRFYTKDSLQLSIWEIQMEKSSFWSTDITQDFLNLMFKLFFKCLDDALVFWMDNLLIYSQTKEEHLKI